ncbi:lipocalin-like domain-containing protein [Spiribacter vilamensis]|uniref:Putative secreted hydrolase n=1 Tax=Spiribacter vilamensis TaxID=531306 RepID=A0A4Q8D1F7_9GAMM|nr:lipocalin-like domain-containing protein [Spiribacter vilamensis]RZU99153.1 putative secreted hydrolase [Spiribacter vilamensis]
MRRIDAGLMGLVGLLIGAVVIGVFRFGLPGSEPRPAAQSLAAAMGPSDDADAYARVTGPRALSFPADHGAHPDHRTEWWYFTGNLTSESGDDYGFQLTLFRTALAPEAKDRPSDWATRQVWMGHFAVTDLARGEHRAAERYQRGALGLAGATTRPVRVWMDDWEIRSDDPDTLFPLTIKADDPQTGIAVDLAIDAARPHVLQGDAGYSQKGEDPANASRYYSYTRLAAEGEVAFADSTASVTGSAWLDREWSTSALDADQAGWDWFALQLEDGRDLMVYRLRRNDGETDRHSAGILVEPDGSSRTLTAEDFRLTAQRYWTSPRTGSRYPVAWELRLPEEGMTLVVEARLDDQEMPTTVRYWEGAVAVEGTASGVGYLEMTGY